MLSPGEECLIFNDDPLAAQPPMQWLPAKIYKNLQLNPALTWGFGVPIECGSSVDKPEFAVLAQ
jgi:hypothetical protein